MTIENVIMIALFLIVVVAILGRQGWVSAQQQAKEAEEAEQVLSAAAATNMSYALEDLPLNLTVGERALAILPRTNLLEVVTATERRGSWGGSTVRVARGVSYRRGSSKSASESHQEIRNVDEGTLVVTNERLAFLGALRTISAKWGKIIGINASSDAVEVHFEGQHKPIYFKPAAAVTLTYTLDDKEHKLRGNARFLKVAIDIARKGGAPRLGSQVH